MIAVLVANPGQQRRQGGRCRRDGCVVLSNERPLGLRNIPAKCLVASDRLLALWTHVGTRAARTEKRCSGHRGSGEELPTGQHGHTMAWAFAGHR